MDTKEEITETDNKADDHKKASKGSRSRKIRTAIIIVEIILILLECAVLYVVNKLDRVQRVAISVDELQENISEEVKANAESGQMKGYTNIALFGVDTRTGDLENNTRSDTILIASINNTTKEVKLVSVFRDTYLNLGNDSYNKANSAYAQGGPTQAINMLNMNLDLNITDFITVGFEGLVDVIDALGGIDIELTDAEVKHLNDYQKIMARQQGKEYIAVTQAGYQHLNGLQATAYCRIRYTSGDDFKRTERQREVLEKVFEAASKASLSELNSIIDAVTDEIYTSLSTSEILGYVSNITSYSIVDTTGIPTSDMRTGATVGRKGSCVIPVTLEANVIWLHEYLFGEENYSPSSKVLEYSEKIQNDSGYTLDEDGNVVSGYRSSSTTTTTTTSGTTTTPSTTTQEDTTTTTDPYAGLMSMTDPNTGATVWYDPYTGAVIDPATGQPTGAMADPATGNVVYPGGTGSSQTATPDPNAQTTTPAVTDPATATPTDPSATTVDPNAAAPAVDPSTTTPDPNATTAAPATTN
ncbi:LCP family protein [Butyrivibrio fibrisolvens]|uniref:LCP family protein n=1 Tax=Butyrivibrio fibrisolvens TaxID=831 RepID=UPI0003B5AE76|nr:LCP family protein [Butyrivibrio fibrisolvens]